MQGLKIKILICLVVVVAALSFSASMEAADISDVKIYFNQNKVEFPTPPVIVDDRVVIPARSFLEAMGSGVQWNEEEMQVKIRHKDSTITIYLDDSYAEINGGQVEMSPSATLVNGSTMVPLRFLIECLDLTITWNAETV